MSSRAQCWLGDFYVGSSEDDIDPGLMSLFRPSDKRVISDARTVVPRHMEHWLENLGEEEGGDLRIVYYSAPVPIVRDRLEVMGNTLHTAREAFEEYVKEKREYYKWSDGQKSELHEQTHTSLQDYYI